MGENTVLKNLKKETSNMRKTIYDRSKGNIWKKKSSDSNEKGKFMTKVHFILKRRSGKQNKPSNTENNKA